MPGYRDETKWNRVRTAILQNPSASDRDIAEVAKCRHAHVRSVREEMTANREITGEAAASADRYPGWTPKPPGQHEPYKRKK